MYSQVGEAADATDLCQVLSQDHLVHFLNGSYVALGPIVSAAANHVVVCLLGGCGISQVV